MQSTKKLSELERERQATKKKSKPTDLCRCGGLGETVRKCTRELLVFSVDRVDTYVYY
eukprot:m.369314 g.369314  ORF g.369314 m.369314 type:complete len:58 (-) comp56116_c0_seq1:2151-2324(-)